MCIFFFAYFSFFFFLIFCVSFIKTKTIHKRVTWTHNYHTYNVPTRDNPMCPVGNNIIMLCSLKGYTKIHSVANIKHISMNVEVHVSFKELYSSDTIHKLCDIFAVILQNASTPYVASVLRFAYILNYFSSILSYPCSLNVNIHDMGHDVRSMKCLNLLLLRCYIFHHSV